MAGIGFELRKIFRKDTIHSRIAGAFYAAITVLGPTILFLVFMFLMQMLFIRLNVTELERNFFMASCLYIFIIATYISGAFSFVVTRYIADLIYEKKYQDIVTALYGMILCTGVISGIVEFIICLVLTGKYNISIGYLLGYDLFGIMLSISYAISVFISSLSEYGKIAKAYFIGLSSAGAVFFFLYQVLHQPVLTSVILCMTAGFIIIDIIIIIYVIETFHPEQFHSFHLKGKWNMKPGGCFYFLRYYKKYPYLALGGFFYNAGLYLPNIIYWYYSDISEQIYGFHTAPSYDMATFLAMFVNLTAMVIFTVKVETRFYEKYRKYIQAINNTSYDTLEKTRRTMNETISEQLFYIYEIQLVIVILSISLAVLFFPILGVGGLTLDFFMLLAIGFYCMYSMYFTVIFLYYFDDQIGACLTTSVFFLVTLTASVLAIQLGIGFYSLPVLIGSVSAWLVGFIRLKYYMKNINAILFTRY